MRVRIGDDEFEQAGRRRRRARPAPRPATARRSAGHADGCALARGQAPSMRTAAGSPRRPSARAAWRGRPSAPNAGGSARAGRRGAAGARARRAPGRWPEGRNGSATTRRSRSETRPDLVADLGHQRRLAERAAGVELREPVRVSRVVRRGLAVVSACMSSSVRCISRHSGLRRTPDWGIRSRFEAVAHLRTGNYPRPPARRRPDARQARKASRNSGPIGWPTSRSREPRGDEQHRQRRQRRPVRGGADCSAGRSR